jgi:serine/threonine protein kinase
MIGKTVAHYSILEKLGEGGMGIVYKAKDKKLERFVALKFLPTRVLGTEKDKARFLREAQAAAALNHDNICTIFEIDEFEGQPFIAMEYIEGRSLKTRIESGPLEIDDAIKIAAQIADGLLAAHERNIIHRDMKSSNVIVDDRVHVKVMDFGLATSPSQTDLTGKGELLGTTAYMSPDQIQGEGVDHRADIWSLGVILYEMVSGVNPFKGDFEQAVIYSILHEEQKPLTTLRSDVPLELERIVNKALSKSPEARYQHIDEMLLDLRELARDLEIGGVGRTRPVRTRPRAARKYLYALPLILVALFVTIKLLVFPGSGDVIESIAVLPLVNLSGDPDQEYFVDGITEALINELSKIKALRVISRTSVMRFKNSDMTIPEIARDLNVDAVVEGSVQRSGDRVRITVLLMNAEPERQIWTGDQERNIGDVMNLNKEVAGAIAGEIEVVVTPEERTRLSSSRAVDPDVEMAYLKGRFYNNNLTIESARRALEYFEDAIEMDPDFAPGYVGKAESYDILASLGAMPDHEAWPLVEVTALKALEIDETLAEAHALLGDVNYTYKWDWKAAEREYKRAIELNPGYSKAHEWYALYLSSMLRHSEAIAEISIARELDPLTLSVRVTEVAIYGAARDYRKAEQLIGDLRDLYPDSYLTQMSIGYLYLRKADYEKALPVFQKMYSTWQDIWVVSALAASYAWVGEEENAHELLDSLIVQSEQGYVPAYNIAMIFHALGDGDRTFEWMDRAYEERSNNLIFIRTLSIFDDLRTDPRFGALMKRLGLE